MGKLIGLVGCLRLERHPKDILCYREVDQRSSMRLQAVVDLGWVSIELQVSHAQVSVHETRNA